VIRHDRLRSCKFLFWFRKECFHHSCVRQGRRGCHGRFDGDRDRVSCVDGLDNIRNVWDMRPFYALLPRGWHVTEEDTVFLWGVSTPFPFCLRQGYSEDLLILEALDRGRSGFRRRVWCRHFWEGSGGKEERGKLLIRTRSLVDILSGATATYWRMYASEQPLS